MATTTIPIGSDRAAKIYGAGLFTEQQRLRSFRKPLMGDMPKLSESEDKMKGQSKPGKPIVQAMDLAQQAGDEVIVDLFNTIHGKPIIGDRNLSGRMMDLTHSSMRIRIDQYRGGVNTGGRMSQKRTIHNLRKIALGQIAGWNSRLEDNLCQVHLSGARGYENTRDWEVPLVDDPDFDKIVINEVKPPTPNRRMFAGDDNESIEDLEQGDKLTFQTVERIRAQLDEMEFPLQPIQYEGDPAAEDEPLYVLYVTSRQWYYMKDTASDRDWRGFLQNAWERASSWEGQGKRHPLFTGSPGMWEGILIRKVRRAVRFPEGQTVQEINKDTGEVEDKTANVDTDRAILLGAEALGVAWGMDARTRYPYNWHEELTDHRNRLEVSSSAIGGKAKIRFETPDGEEVDHGVMTIDSEAPEVPGTEGAKVAA